MYSQAIQNVFNWGHTLKNRAYVSFSGGKFGDRIRRDPLNGYLLSCDCTTKVDLKLIKNTQKNQLSKSYNYFKHNFCGDQHTFPIFAAMLLRLHRRNFDLALQSTPLVYGHNDGFGFIVLKRTLTE